MASSFKHVTGAADRDSRIVKQLEFYFSDTNLPYDKFLQAKIKLNDGWVPISVLLTFKMLKSITRDSAVIASAVKDAVGSIVEVDETGVKIRRKPKITAPVPDRQLFKDIVQRSIYCSGFPRTTTVDELLEFAATFGENVITKTTPMRFRSQAFKGCLYFTFSTKDEAEKFLARESVEYNGVEIKRMWENDFLGNFKPHSPFNYE
ncbi:la protein homolog [Metopolophium dirhodum]|uniref:la protein homolog n=1 Tax=Metopolophium dirhodum TaxID=44670 RepID=UPI00298FCCFE|nr:la protein homolog [Metopolophium dirhodum]XP_060872722.1 la protein homolog [Metopolophium dirhodum]XP_060872723.1 la protein homolog [Metopolophium dirhodum]